MVGTQETLGLCGWGPFIAFSWLRSLSEPQFPHCDTRTRLPTFSRCQVEEMCVVCSAADECAQVQGVREAFGGTPASICPMAPLARVPFPHPAVPCSAAPAVSQSHLGADFKAIP